MEYVITVVDVFCTLERPAAILARGVGGGRDSGRHSTTSFSGGNKLSNTRILSFCNRELGEGLINLLQ